MFAGPVHIYCFYMSTYTTATGFSSTWQCNTKSPPQSSTDLQEMWLILWSDEAMSYQKVNIHQPAVGLHIARVESINKLGDCEELRDIFSYMNL